MSGTMMRAPAVKSARTRPGLPSAGGLGSGSAPPNTSLNIFWRWLHDRQNALEVSELPKSIDSKSMQQDYNRALPLVVISDPRPIKDVKAGIYEKCWTRKNGSARIKVSAMQADRVRRAVAAEVERERLRLSGLAWLESTPVPHQNLVHSENERVANGWWRDVSIRFWP
jgi:hypothetical protein